MSGKLPFGELYAIPSRNGLTRPSSVRSSGYRMAAMGEIFAADYVGDSEMDRVQLNDRELSAMMLEDDDLLFARQSLVLSGAGKCAIVRGLSEPTTFESHLIRVRLDKNKANPLFYMYYFRSGLSPMKAIVQQGVQAGIRGSDLNALMVDCPDRPVQDRIGAILSDYDAAIANCRKQIALLEEAAQRLYREWFGDGKGNEDLLWNVCHYTRGVSYTSKEIESPNGMPLITLKNIERFGGFREVFREAIRWCAKSIVVAHNHPSGDPSPSDEDVTMTRELVTAGELLGVKVQDHLIIGGPDSNGGSGYVSLRDQGLV